jgi:NADPH:quinone reductase-like Zn-dependent oxidoreductase
MVTRDEEVTMSAASTTIPKTMKAEVIDRFGPPEEVMRTAMIPVPELGDDEVLIDVSAAGVGVWDIELCKGEFGTEAGLPRVLGTDGAGTVIAAGSKVQRLAVGDRVYAFGLMNPKGGFYAEYAVISQNEVSKVPGTLSLDQAGVLAADGLTALAGLDRVRLVRNQTTLILGASGGVGHLAVELAKRIGARVLAIASGSDGVELARRVGADHTIEGHQADVVAKARAFAPNGVDAALILAGDRADDLLALVKPGGRAAYPNGVVPEPQPRTGITLDAYDGYRGRDALERLNRLIGNGPFHVEVSRTYSLEETPRAIVDATRHHLGKLAVRVRGS